MGGALSRQMSEMLQVRLQGLPWRDLRRIVELDLHLVVSDGIGNAARGGRVAIERDRLS